MCSKYAIMLFIMDKREDVYLSYYIFFSSKHPNKVHVLLSVYYFVQGSFWYNVVWWFNFAVVLFVTVTFAILILTVQIEIQHNIYSSLTNILKLK